jgi:hypothetical protein
MSRIYISQALKAHLKERGLTYLELSKILEISETEVARII